ncbi:MULTISPECIES: S26 family signal peptidase [Mycetohabitans]|nr:MULTISPECIES: S26 family signal peptidase [Mycetohabitans]MCG1048712.1 S26 family signal peptidase [Mycetohabitans sp. B6]
MNTKCLYLSLCAGIFGMSLLAVAAMPWLVFTINLTKSLPGTFYVIHKGGSLSKGDLIAYRWHGGATYPAGTTFIKRVAGVPGDTVKRDGTAFFVNDQYIGVAQPFSKAGVPLAPAKGGPIQPGEYFVATPNPDSLDSRYALTGNVKQVDVIGRAYEVF